MASAAASATVARAVTFASPSERLGASRDGPAPRPPRVPRRPPVSPPLDGARRWVLGARGGSRAAATASDDGTPGDPEPFKIAIIGAGFAGVAAAYHLMLRCAEGLDDSPAAPTATADALQTSRRRPVEVHLFDEKGIAGGASGVAAGLLHPYTPRGKIIWRGVEGVAATLALVAAAEDAERRLDSGAAVLDDDDGAGPHDRRGESIAWRRGTVRPAKNLKQARDLAKFAPSNAEGGGVAVDAATLRAILPGVAVPDEVEDATLGIDGANLTDEYDEPFDTKEMASKVDTDGTGASGVGDPRVRGTNARERRAASRKASAPTAAALHIPGGVVLDSGRYLRALWNATKLLASSTRTPRGSRAVLRVERAVRSLTSDERVGVEGGTFDACVVACGAAVGSIAELSVGPSGCVLPLSNQGGHVVELVPKPGSIASPWDERAPGILGAPYVAPLGVGRLLVGATKEFGASCADARRAGVVDPGLDDAAQEAARALVADASVTYPPLSGMDVDVVRYGVRANPPRTPAGSLPLMGRIEGIGGDGDGDEKSAPGDGDGDGEAGRRSWWFVGGLGARGLVYHAMLGAIVAEAVMRRDPSGIPAELRFDPRVVST